MYIVFPNLTGQGNAIANLDAHGDQLGSMNMWITGYTTAETMQWTRERMPYLKALRFMHFKALCQPNKIYL